SETLKEIEKVSSVSKPNNPKFDIDGFTKNINERLAHESIDWHGIATLFGEAISQCIGSEQFELILELIKQANEKFQEHIQTKYAQIKNSNPIKRPQIVSKILDYIDFNYKQDIIALIVIDGLSFWQYALIKNRLPGNKKEVITFSW